jgi:tetratricopeptide (TPR) repeat protein
MGKSFDAKRRYSVCSFLLFLAFFSCQYLLAIDGRIQGVVSDETGKPLGNVKITVYDPSRGLSFSTTTNKDGRFFKRGIIPSSYEIVFELDGYVSVRNKIEIRADWTEEMNVKLQRAKIARASDFELGSKYFNEGNYPEAIVYFKQATEVSPGFAMAYYNLGLSYLRNGSKDEAVGALKKALEIMPDMVTAYLALGECYVEMEKYEDALKSFNRALVLQPSNPKTYFNLGIIYNKNNQVEEAISAFENSEKLDPSFSANQYELGLTYLKKGDYEKSVSHFERFLVLQPNAPEADQVKKIIAEFKAKKPPAGTSSGEP